MQTCNFITNTLQHKCFHMKFARFSEQPFYITPVNGCLWKIWTEETKIMANNRWWSSRICKFRQIALCVPSSFFSLSSFCYLFVLEFFLHHAFVIVIIMVRPWSSSSGSSRLEMFCKKGVLKNSSKLTGKHLYRSLFFNKVAGLPVAASVFWWVPDVLWLYTIFTPIFYKIVFKVSWILRLNWS